MPTPEELKKLNEATRAQNYQRFQENAVAAQQQQQAASASTGKGFFEEFKDKIRDAVGLKDGLSGKFNQLAQQVSELPNTFAENGVGIGGRVREAKINEIVNEAVDGKPNPPKP